MTATQHIRAFYEPYIFLGSYCSTPQPMALQPPLNPKAVEGPQIPYKGGFWTALAYYYFKCISKLTHTKIARPQFS